MCVCVRAPTCLDSSVHSDNKRSFPVLVGTPLHYSPKTSSLFKSSQRMEGKQTNEKGGGERRREEEEGGGRGRRRRRSNVREETLEMKKN